MKLTKSPHKVQLLLNRKESKKMKTEKNVKLFKIELTEEDLDIICCDDYMSVETILSDIICQAKKQGYKRDV